jgi:hypothetical protein
MSRQLSWGGGEDYEGLEGILSSCGCAASLESPAQPLTPSSQELMCYSLYVLI